jgi:hypothetical protein
MLEALLRVAQNIEKLAEINVYSLFTASPHII